METVIEPVPHKTATAKPSAAPAPARPTLRQLLPWALASSLLLYLAYFPVAWGWLGWVALVPLCVVMRSDARGRSVVLAAWICGLCFYFPALQWMRVADARMYATWCLLAFYCSLYVPICVLFVRALDRRGLPLVLTLPAVWTGFELVRSHLLGGFFWYFLGHTQHDFLPLIQIADVTGGHGITFLVAAVNAIIFEWAWHAAGWPFAVRRPVLVFQSALVLLVFAGFLVYGSIRMNQANFEKGPRLALVQGNVEQRIRYDWTGPEGEAKQQAIEHMRADYNTLARLAAAQLPELIVYPETSFMQDWEEIITDAPERLTERAQELIAETRKLERDVAAMHAVGQHRPHVMLGLNANEWYPGNEVRHLRFNSALLIGPEGNTVGRYDKIHRVPFGEYIPLREELPFMNWFSPYDYDYSIAPGRQQTRLPLGKYRFGVVICYEDTDLNLTPKYVAPSEGRKADFLVNISNDGWFDGTSEHEEHLAISRFRAVEMRRSIARSVNMGISAVVDGNGQVLAPEVIDRREGAYIWEIGPKAGGLPLSRWGEFKSVSGVLLASIPIDDRDSFYAVWGDWLPWGCWGLIVIALFALRARPIPS
jgi:apolipoprotein N-acyltransferase